MLPLAARLQALRGPVAGLAMAHHAPHLHREDALQRLTDESEKATLERLMESPALEAEVEEQRRRAKRDRRA